jgi:ADP-ribosylglycohydrolase
MKNEKGNYTLMGAIVGDYMGSRYEFMPTKELEFTIDKLHSNITDDSILTIAVADAVLSGIPYKWALHYWAIKFPSPMGGYGGSFSRWLADPLLEAYNSFGNGSAMRVSAVGWLFDTLEETLEQAYKSAECTHSHPEGCKGACAVAACIYMLRHGQSRAELVQYIEQQFGYDLHFNLEELRKTYTFDETCMGCVPVAIKCYLESTSWERAVRLAVSMGGDADTLGAITGSIAMADKDSSYYIPPQLEQQALERLTTQQQSIVEEFEFAVYNHEPLF